MTRLDDSKPPISNGHAPQDPVERLATMVSIEGIERAILAFAVHPDGGGFERAHLVLHDPHADELVAWSGVAATPSADESLDQSMVRAAMAPEASGTEPARRRTTRWKPDALEGLASIAWQVGLAIDDASDDSWTATREGAVRLEGVTADHGLLLGAWGGDEDLAVRRERLERTRRIASRLFTAWARHDGARRAARQTDALAELARSGASSHNVIELLHEALRLVAADDAASGAAVWTVDSAAGRSELRLSVTGGIQEAREQDARALEPSALRALRNARAQWCDQPGEGMPLLAEGAVARLAVLPLIAYERVTGVLAIWSRAEARPDRPGPWSPADRAFLSGVADLLAMAFDQAERCHRLKATEQRADELKRRLRHLERMAERGASAVAATQSARNPIVSITAFARRLQGSFAADAPEREYLDVVLREAERIERMLEQHPAAADDPAAEVGIESPNRLVQEALQRHAEILVRRRVRLVKKLAPDVPRLRIDAQRVREAVSALLTRSLDSVAVAGRMRVETRRAQGCVIVEIAHDGPRVPGAALEDLDHVFGPDGRGAPGLEAARRIVADHGGELRVRSEGEWSAIIGLSLPILGNEDRRRANDRRSGHRDRRLPHAVHASQPPRG
jgi:nitrogen-specific signal transduction histidine kinase